MRRFEDLRAQTGVKADEQFYGFGGWLVSDGSGVSRDRVAAVYKLSQSGKRAAMKFSNDTSSGDPTDLRAATYS